MPNSSATRPSLAPLFPLVMPGVDDLWSYGETGYHALAAAVVKERYRREAMTSALRILGEGQLSLTKFLIVLDRAVDLRDIRATLAHLLARTRPEADLYVLANVSMDTLDGHWSYEYDNIGQLTHAVFTPAQRSSIPAQDLRYVYDAVGNRIRTIENGVTVEYTTNNLNQYTQVGSTTYQYDADGNLTNKVAPEGTTTCEWSPEN